jgi:hypothetical protein
MKSTAFWDIVPYSLIEVGWSFRGEYCHHHHQCYFSKTTQCNIPDGCNLYNSIVEVMVFGAMWICRLMPVFWRNMLSPSSGLKWQGREIKGLYRTWRARAGGREPLRGREYGNGMRTNREPSGRLLGGGSVWSGRREENDFFRAHRGCRVLVRSWCMLA